jgi:hypothetical protein
LLTDYVLTVSVSIAAGVAALTSVFPGLFDYRVPAGVAFVGLLMLGNLRGIRESARMFAAPTYVYLVSIFGLLGYGLVLMAMGRLPLYEAPPEWQHTGAEGEVADSSRFHDRIDGTRPMTDENPPGTVFRAEIRRVRGRPIGPGPVVSARAGPSDQRPQREKAGRRIRGTDDLRCVVS